MPQSRDSFSRSTATLGIFSSCRRIDSQYCCPTWPTKLRCASLHKGKLFASASEPFDESVTNLCRIVERCEIATKPCLSIRRRLRVSVVRSITKICARRLIATGASFAIVTSRANCVERILAGFSAASNSCVTALAAFRKLEHAQYSVPCRLRAELSGLFEVHIHIRSRKNTTSHRDRLWCHIHPFGSF